MSNVEHVRDQLKLSKMDQEGFVYRDLEAATKSYEPPFGPFGVQQYGAMEWEYRGEVEESQLFIAFRKSGDIEIKLNLWVFGLTPYKEFIDAGREGMHHLRISVTNLEQIISAAEELGNRSISQKRFDEKLTAAYLEGDNDPLFIEFLENQYGHQL